MAIHSGGFGGSEQRRTLVFSDLDAALTNGSTGTFAFIPFPCTLDAFAFSAMNIGSAPVMSLIVNRFIPGVGATAITIGNNITVTAFGTSGAMVGGVTSSLCNGVSLLASVGITNVLFPGDVFGYQMSGGTTAAIFGIAGYCCVKTIQDKVSHLGAVPE